MTTRKFDLLTYINHSAYFPNSIDFPDFWGDSPVIGEVIEVDNLLLEKDKALALDYLFEEGKVLKVKTIKSYVENNVHIRVFQMELA